MDRREFISRLLGALVVAERLVPAIEKLAKEDTIQWYITPQFLVYNGYAIALIDLWEALPVIPNGGDITVNWPSDSAAIMRL